MILNLLYFYSLAGIIYFYFALFFLKSQDYPLRKKFIMLAFCGPIFWIPMAIATIILLTTGQMELYFGKFKIGKIKS